MEVDDSNRNMKDDITVNLENIEKHEIEIQEYSDINSILERGDYKMGYTNISEDKKDILTKDEQTNQKLTIVINDLIKLRKEVEENNKINVEAKVKNFHPEAVIIGAGPVGCWTAIQLRQRGFTGKITLYEKYERYARTNMIKLPNNKDVKPRNKIIEDLFNKKISSIQEVEENLLKILKTMKNVFINNIFIDCFNKISLR